MLVIKRFSERKKVFRERKRTEKIHGKSPTGRGTHSMADLTKGTSLDVSTVASNSIIKTHTGGHTGFPTTFESGFLEFTFGILHLPNEDNVASLLVRAVMDAIMAVWYKLLAARSDNSCTVQNSSLNEVLAGASSGGE
ncbi:hypothetical protein Tco_0731537, partial [Tanacetum coccineum]